MYLWTVMKSAGRRGGCSKWPGQPRQSPSDRELTLDDLEGQYCNRNCKGCSASFLGKRFYCEKNSWKLCPMFLLVIYDCSYLYRLAKRPRVTACDVCYTCVHPSFWEQRFVYIAFMELCHSWEIAFSPWLEVGCWA